MSAAIEIFYPTEGHFLPETPVQVLSSYGKYSGTWPCEDVIPLCYVFPADISLNEYCQVFIHRKSKTFIFHENGFPPFKLSWERLYEARYKNLVSFEDGFDIIYTNWTNTQSLSFATFIADLRKKLNEPVTQKFAWKMSQKGIVYAV